MELFELLPVIMFTIRMCDNQLLFSVSASYSSFYITWRIKLLPQILVLVNILFSPDRALDITHYFIPESLV